MNLRLKRARELAGYAVQLTKDEGLPTMLKRGAGVRFVSGAFCGGKKHVRGCALPRSDFCGRRGPFLHFAP